MEFIQLIEFKTTQFEAVEAALNEFYAQTEGKRSGHGSTCADRDRADTYVSVIRFPSIEAAEANNQMPETQALSEQLMTLCDGPPSFTNLDVLFGD